ncbi:porin family protein [Pontibacter sp. G13]|uniref:porin family protein n=1 Tax=Pontibacter sp. G13 TaxID=3074898 RepID=UPI002889B5C5|nr:porin family protein [Pontibacter sp. G13]WNJ21417.1 porin family protein [Pontibacter sp. G13]
MKNLYLPFVAVLMVIALPSQAQRGLKLGAFGIPQISAMYNMDDASLDEDLYTMEPYVGMAGGLEVGYNFNEYIGVRLNTIFSQEGGRYSFKRTIEERTMVTTRLNYFKLPLMIGFNSFNYQGTKYSFMIYAGVSANFLTGAETYNDDPSLDIAVPESFKSFPTTKETYAPIYYSAVVDLGYQIVLGEQEKVSLIFALRGEMGLTDSEDKDETFFIYQNGSVDEIEYWDTVGGPSRNAVTNAINIGLRVGVLYSFGD